MTKKLHDEAFVQRYRANQYSQYTLRMWMRAVKLYFETEAALERYRHLRERLSAPATK